MTKGKYALISPTSDPTLNMICEESQIRHKMDLSRRPFYERAYIYTIRVLPTIMIWTGIVYGIHRMLSGRGHDLPSSIVHRPTTNLSEMLSVYDSSAHCNLCAYNSDKCLHA